MTTTTRITTTAKTQICLSELRIKAKIIHVNTITYQLRLKHTYLFPIFFFSFFNKINFRKHFVEPLFAARNKPSTKNYCTSEQPHFFDTLLNMSSSVASCMWQVASSIAVQFHRKDITPKNKQISKQSEIIQQPLSIDIHKCM